MSACPIYFFFQIPLSLSSLLPCSHTWFLCFALNDHTRISSCERGSCTSLLFLLLGFWVDRFCCFLLLLLFWFTLCWSSAVTWELDIWKNLRFDLMVDSSRENAIICLWQELREALRQGLLFQTTQAVKYDTLDCMRTSCGLGIQGKFCLFLHSGQIYFGFFFSNSHFLWRCNSSQIPELNSSSPASADLILLRSQPEL